MASVDQELSSGTSWEAKLVRLFVTSADTLVSGFDVADLHGTSSTAAWNCCRSAPRR